MVTGCAYIMLYFFNNFYSSLKIFSSDTLLHNIDYTYTYVLNKIFSRKKFKIDFNDFTHMCQWNNATAKMIWYASCSYSLVV